jgi:hypothetical protein
MTSFANRIAVIDDAESTASQPLLAAATARWRDAGAKVAGVIAETHGIAGRTCGAGFLRDIASGRPYSIYRDAVPTNTTCHLDASGVEAACANLRDQIPACDLVVLSKFGKLEAMNAGLATAFAAAIAAGTPVLTTVSAKHRDAWRAFVSGATRVAANEAALDAWWRSVNATKDAARSPA